MKYQSDWVSYKGKIDNQIASILVDLGAKQIAPNKSYSRLLWIWIAINSVDKNGLPTTDEYLKIHEIENSFIAINSKKSPIFIGRVDTSRHVEFYFFVPKAGNFKRKIDQTMSQYPDYNYKIGLRYDPQWTQYFNYLYPQPEMYRRIQNMKIVEALKNAGDKLEKPRNIMHWSYFKDEQSREKYIQNIILLGFLPNNNYKTYEVGTLYPFGIMIERIDSVDLNSLDRVVLELWQLSKKYNGDYDGWETSVEE